MVWQGFKILTENRLLGLPWSGQLITGTTRGCKKKPLTVCLYNWWGIYNNCTKPFWLKFLTMTCFSLTFILFSGTLQTAASSMALCYILAPTKNRWCIYFMSLGLTLVCNKVNTRCTYNANKTSQNKQKYFSLWSHHNFFYRKQS